MPEINKWKCSVCGVELELKEFGAAACVPGLLACVILSLRFTLTLIYFIKPIVKSGYDFDSSENNDEENGKDLDVPMEGE